ncbi:hypothetical protein SAMN04488527_1582 [Aliiroseovarius crassostreae]|nr:hypothetical protein SAMN04488527_1582 [Aliiroseovarius crassostreae]
MCLKFIPKRFRVLTLESKRFTRASLPKWSGDVSDLFWLIDATLLKAHRTASSPGLKKGGAGAAGGSAAGQTLAR